MKNTKVDLTIIILSFNTSGLLRTCLKKIYESKLNDYKIEVIVCDNGSTDGSIAMTKAEFPRVAVIDNHKNIGFAAGNNPGIKRAQGRYILLLNSDTEIEPDALNIMLKYMDTNPSVGAATCKLVLADGSIDPACHRGFPSPWAAITYFLGLEKLFPKVKFFSEYHELYKDFSTIHEVDMISGAFFLVRAEAVKQVGLMDEDYFFYGEDMDWCFRIKEHGWKIIYNPMARVLHLKKKSGRANADRARRVRTELFFYKYNKLFYQKNYKNYKPKILIWLVYLLFDIRIFFLEKLAI